MKIMFAFLSPVFASSLAIAANSIPEMTCLSAGGYYGSFAIRQIDREIEIIGQQGFAHELTSQLGVPSGHEATRIDLRFSPHQCVAGLKGALRCQGVVKAIVERYVAPEASMTTFNTDVVVRPTNPGHEVTVTLGIPNTRRQAKAIVHFKADMYGACLIREVLKPK